MKIQTILATSVAAITLFASNSVSAGEYTGNVAVASNYIFRGKTQTADLSAISGGIDWSHPDGIYISGWTSNLTAGDYELDLYGGYIFNMSDVELDLGLINYRYPVTGDTPSNVSEVYAIAKRDNYTLGAYFTVSKDGTEKDNDLYLYGAAGFEMKKNLNLEVTLGSYNFDDSGSEDYFHVQVALKKDNFTFAIDKNSDDKSTGSDAMRITVGYSKSVDF